MTIKKSQRLHIVLELAERDENEATEAVQVFRKRLQDEQQRLLELKEYYQEYENLFSRQRSGIRASEIASQRQFLVELIRMQDRQTQQIAIVEKGLNQKLDAWRRCHLKYQALEQLIARIKQEENRVLDRKEQKLLDEWFARVQSTIHK